MQNNSFRASLTYSTHFISASGDLRAQYVPWDNPPSGNPGYTYLKCEHGQTAPYLDFWIFNQDTTGTQNATVTINTAIIAEDAALYNNPADDPSDPYLTPPVWSAPAGVGTNGVITVTPGGRVRTNFTVPFANVPGLGAGSGVGTSSNLVVRLSTTAAVKLEAWCSAGGIDEY